MKSRMATIRAAFTLIELLVVITMILLAMTIALPSMMSAFRSGADAQAVNIVSATCSAARVLAFKEGLYTCVHHQLATGPKSGGGGYLAICIRDPNTGLFRLAPGYDPQQLPGDMALGDVSSYTVDASGFKLVAGTDPGLLMCFSIVFSPVGKVVVQIEGQPAKFDQNDPAFRTNDANTQIWDINVANPGGAGKPGSSAMTVFHYGQYLARSAADRQTYLNQNGQFLPVNVHTGQLYPRK